MKRDMDLVRDILLLIEASECCGFDWRESNFESLGKDYTVIWYHIKIMVDGGLLECEKAKYADQYDSLYITAKGHEFLDCVRNADVWHTVKERIAITGGAPLEVIKWLAQEEVRKVVR
jgi:hypothetical protein